MISDSAVSPTAALPYQVHRTMISPFFAHPEARSADLVLDALPMAVAVARRFTEEWLTCWHLGKLADTAVLIVSELITNSIKATGSPDARPSEAQRGTERSSTVLLRLRAHGASLFVEVEDEDPRPPILRHVGNFDEDGRGLALVVALSRTWGHRSISGGKTVWAELGVPADLLSEQADAKPSALPRRVPSCLSAGPIKSVPDLDTLRRVHTGL